MGAYRRPQRPDKVSRGRKRDAEQPEKLIKVALRQGLVTRRAYKGRRQDDGRGGASL